MNGNGLSLELDGTTAHLLARLAQAWGVTKEEAIRRAVAQAQTTSSSVNTQGRLEAFKELQRCHSFQRHGSAFAQSRGLPDRRRGSALWRPRRDRQRAGLHLVSEPRIDSRMSATRE